MIPYNKNSITLCLDNLLIGFLFSSQAGYVMIDLTKEVACMRMPRGLHGVLVHELGQRIAQGTYKTGDALSPDEVATQFDASRPTVREALRVLESKGMLRIRQSLGTRVQPVEMWNLLDSEVVGWRLRGQDREDQIRELIEMRLAVEPIAAGLAATNQDPEAVRSLETAWMAMEGAVEKYDVQGFTDADVAFHAALLHGSGNQMFDHLTALIATALEARGETLSSHHADISAEALAQHRLVLRAIADGHGALAQTTMDQMLRGLLTEPVDVPGEVEGQPAKTAVG